MRSQVIVTESLEFEWPETRAKSNASFPCPDNPSFKVIRYCDASGQWGQYDKDGCGKLRKKFTMLADTSNMVRYLAVIATCAVS